jgi:predicted RNA-binding Zn-ribbon protein involved in translation (DUF1610 family)
LTRQFGRRYLSRKLTFSAFTKITFGFRNSIHFNDVVLLLHLCANCGDAMMAATSSKYVSEQYIRNSWSCDVCGFE